MCVERVRRQGVMEGQDPAGPAPMLATATARGLEFRQRLGFGSAEATKATRPKHQALRVRRSTPGEPKAAAPDEHNSSAAGPGVRTAGDAICWPAFKRRGCSCGTERQQRLLHLPAKYTVCPAHLSHVLGQSASGCQDASHQSHMPAGALLEAVLGWWGVGWELVPPAAGEEDANGGGGGGGGGGSGDDGASAPPPSEMAVAAAENGKSVLHCVPCGPRAPPAVTVGDRAAPWASVEFWAAEVAAKHPANGHLAALLAEPWFGGMLADRAAAKLWRGNRRKLLKELTEAYAVVQLVRDGLRAAAAEAEATSRAAAEAGQQRVQAVPAVPAVDGDTGAGAVVFDVCAGKGIATLLLSCALPQAVVVLMDSDLRMDLGHLAGREATGQLGLVLG